MPHEYELKFLGIDKDALRKTLESRGYKLAMPERLMKRETFYFPQNHPQRKTHWGRVRDEGNKITASRKWYESLDRISIDTIHEECREVKSWEDGLEWVKELGYTDMIYQENTREEWRKSGIEVCLDTWPGLRTFAEVEGPDEAAVLSAAAELGFNPQDGVAGSVSEVCRIELGLSSKEVAAYKVITFEQPLRRKPVGV